MGKRFPYTAGMVVLFCMFFAVHTSSAQTPKQGPPPSSLPASLQDLDIQDAFIPAASTQKVGVIHALRGRVVVVHGDTRDAYYGREGDPIYENDRLTTLENARCRIRFLNEDVVTMAPETSFTVERFVDQREKGRQRSVFSMLKGKAMFYALRLFGYRDRRFTLKTPTAVAGIRGTKFGVHVYWVDEEKAGSTTVRLASRDRRFHPLSGKGEPGPAGQSFTDLFSEDGIIALNGKTIGPGEFYRGRRGEVIPIPPGYVRRFEASTSVEATAGEGQEDPGQGETDESVGEVGEDGDDDTGLTGFADLIGDLMTDTTQQQTGEETVTQGEDITQGKTAEEVSGIAALIVKPSGVAWTGLNKGPVYEGGPNTLQPGASTHVAYEEENWEQGDFKMVVQEESDTSMDAKVTQFGWGPGTSAIGSPRSFTWHQGGRYTDASGHEYLSWGWWEDEGGGPNPGQIGTDGSTEDYYAATKKIWEVEGARTHPDYIAYLQQINANYQYTGEGKGVLAKSVAGFAPAELSGPFSCQINFGTRAVSNFHLNLTGGGQTVQMTGSGTMDPTGQIDITPSGGSIAGNALDIPESGAGGAVVGGKAEGVAGTWWAHGGSDWYGVGEYHGKR